MFTAEISENKAIFLDTIVFKGELFTEKSILDINTHYKAEFFNIHTLPRAVLWE